MKFSIATFNVENLIGANKPIYDDPRPLYSETEYLRKISWIKEQLLKMNADVIGFQEIFEEKALRDCLVGTPMEHWHLFVANPTGKSPVNAIVSKYPILKSNVIETIPFTFDFFDEPAMETILESTQIDIPIKKFSRGILSVEIKLNERISALFIVLHLKSKRPIYPNKFDQNKATYPEIAKGNVRSLIRRGIESCGIRHFLSDEIGKDENKPIFILGDLNDNDTAVTNQAIVGEDPFRNLPPDEKVKRWKQVFQNCKDVQARKSIENFHYSYIHNGHYESLDNIFISNHFAELNKEKIGRIIDVRLYNDHVIDTYTSMDRKPKHITDHGQVVANIDLTIISDMVKTLISTEANISVNDNTDMDQLFNDFGDLMMLKENLEMNFNVIIEPTELSECKKVSTVCDLIEKKLSNTLTFTEKTSIRISMQKPDEFQAKIFWGKERHELIAELADGLLTPKAQNEISKVLAKINEHSLKSIAVWADDIKYSPDKFKDDDTIEFLKKYKQTHWDWHFVNLPLDASEYSREKYSIFTRDTDVVQMTMESIRVLLKKSNSYSELNALRWLVHLVGDIHQPMHVGCGYIQNSNTKPFFVFDPQTIIQDKLERNHDLGGNLIVLPNNKKLHSFWDTDLPEIENGVFTPQIQPIVDIDELVELPAKWATETLECSRIAYQSLKIVSKTAGEKFSYTVLWDNEEKYIDRCVPIVKQQKDKAASRLAFLLNTIYT